MQKFLLTIAYDGSSFAGWQIQPNQDTVQQRIQDALAQIAGTSITLHGSGRTDTGVHADAQTAHFTAPHHTTLTAHNWPKALNTKLPPSIRILSCHPVPCDFHARFSATAKTYTYQIYNGPILPPKLYNRAWHLPAPIKSLDTLDAALHLLKGTHDFRLLSARRGNEPQSPPLDFYHRTISHCQLHIAPHPLVQPFPAAKPPLTTPNKLITLTFRGNGFLYRMVRFITAALIDTGKQKLTPQQFQQLLNATPNSWPNPKCAPPQGLTLTQVHYPDPP